MEQLCSIHHYFYESNHNFQTFGMKSLGIICKWEQFFGLFTTQSFKNSTRDLFCFTDFVCLNLDLVRVGGTLWHWYWYSSQFHLTWYILFSLNSNLNRDTTFFSKFKHESFLFCGTLISDSVMLLYWIR